MIKLQLTQKQMKLKILFVCSVCALLCLACIENDKEIAGYGSLTLDISADYKVNEVTSTTRSEIDNTVPETVLPSTSDFKISIFDAQGGVYKEWEKFSQYTPDTQYPIGTYSLKASYGNIEEEGFDLPYYEGTSPFTIANKQESVLDVTCYLANVKVSIDYTDAFKKYFTDYSATIHVNGGKYIKFDKNETRSAYIKPGDINIILSMTKQDGKTTTFEPSTITGAIGKEHYRLKFDVNNGEVGDAQLLISFDNSTTEKPITIDLSEDFWNSKPPYAINEGFESNIAQEIIELGEVSAPSVNTMINARGGISTCTLTTNSAYLLSHGWPAEIDLANADIQNLTNNGLKVNWLKNTKGERTMAVIDFTNLIPELMIADNSDTHEFGVVIKDKFGKVNEPVILKIKNTPLEIILNDPEPVYIGSNEALIPVQTNGEFDQIKIKYLYAGVWQECSNNEAVSVDGNSYIKANIITANEPVSILATYRDKKNSEEKKLNVKVPEYSITINPADVWAHKSTISLKASDSKYQEVINKYANIYLSNDGNDWKKTNASTENGYYLIESLSAATTYHVKASCMENEFSESQSFLTEEELSLEDPSLEKWTDNTRKSLMNGASFWSYVDVTANYPESYWACVNQKTFEGSPNVKSTYNIVPSALKRTGRTGNCALIRTVGWDNGSGNSGINLKHVAAGKLFMGTYSFDHNNNKDTYNYGQPFTSRPACVKFWYKYLPNGSDNFKAWVVVESRTNGEIIRLGAGEITGGETTEFTENTIPITYTNTSLKATHMYIAFSSSAACSDEEGTETSNLKSLVENGEIDGYTHYEGSNLYIDDISLTY